MFTIEAEREREEALFFESQPYNAFQAADREAHYLYAAGYVTYCWCSRCEAEQEARMQEADELYAFADEFAAADHPLFAMYARAMEDARDAAHWEDGNRPDPNEPLPPF